MPIPPHRALAAARVLLLLLWLVEILVVLGGGGALAAPATVGLALYAALALVVARPGTRRLALLFGAVAAGLAALGGRPFLLVEALAFATLFPAFLATIVLARVVAGLHPAVARTRQRIDRLARRERETGFMLAGHFLGAVVTAGSFPILGPLVPDGADAEARRGLALACLRGANLAVLWSPFFVGMAFVTRYLPDVPLWQIIALGLGLAALAFAVAILAEGAGGFAGLPSALRALAPILPRVAGIAGLIVAASTALGTSSLETVFLVVPPAAALWLLLQPRTVRREVGRRGWEGLGGVADEMLLVVAVTVLARVLAGLPVAEGIAAELARLPLPPVLLLAGLLALVVAAGAFGVHPMATVAVILALLTGEAAPVAPLALAGLGLLGWGLGTMIGTTSLSVLMASTSFKVPVPRLVFGANLRFVLVYGALAVAVLGAVDALLRG